MFFLLNRLTTLPKLFLNNITFILNNIKILLIKSCVTNLITQYNPKLFLNFFKKQSFSNDFIFHFRSKAYNNNIAFIKNGTTMVNTNYGINIPVFLENNYVLTSPIYFLKKLNFFSYSVCIYFKKSFSFGFYYLRGFFFILFIDACLTDDEPLWEPIEWSLVQTWILFIFGFAWIAENLIVSRYGSYTGRDKRVWIAWYKTFWLIEGYYVINYGVVCIYVIIPFYFETNYNLSFVYSWWHWYSRVFFFKFISLYTIVLLMVYLLQLNLRWLNWKKGLIIILLTNIFVAYLIFTHFIMVFFGYFTDPVWYQKSRPVDYIQLSHEPYRWGWGPARKDHFTYHNVKTVFWFKNDGPFASSFLMFHLFLFICLFFLFFFWLTLLRRVWATKEIPTTLTTYCVSSLRQFFYFFLLLYIFIITSFLTNYMRLPLEYFYYLDNKSWVGNLFAILQDYPTMLISLFF